MGDINQYQFVLEQKGKLDGPFLEIGFRDYGNAQDAVWKVNPGMREPPASCRYDYRCGIRHQS